MLIRCQPVSQSGVGVGSESGAFNAVSPRTPEKKNRSALPISHECQASYNPFVVSQ